MHDDNIHGFGIFSRHARDYDPKTFLKYASDRERGLSAAEMLKAADIGKKGSGSRGPVGPKALHSGSATPVGLSLAVGGSSTECVLHPGNVFTHLCQSHLKCLCLKCLEDLEAGKTIQQTNGKSSLVGKAAADNNCTKNVCRSVISRLDLSDNIAKVRRLIEAEVNSLHSLLGNEPNGPKSVFYQVKDKIDALKAQLEVNLAEQNKRLRLLLEGRLANIDAANMEVADRQKHLLEEQFVRLGWAKDFNSSMLKAGKYLSDKETIECLEVQELEHLLQQLEFYSVIRVNDIPYALGRASFEVDGDSSTKLANYLQIDDDRENDKFKKGVTATSAATPVPNLYELHRLVDLDAKGRDVGAGDFPYFFFVRIIKVSPTTPYVRIGFIDKHTVPPEDTRLADRHTHSFAFECPHNGELNLVRSDSGAATPIELIRDADTDSAAAAVAFRAGTTVGVYFDRKKNVAQVFVNGKPSQELSFTKLGYKFEYESVNPVVGLEQNGSQVAVEFARFVPDLASVPQQFTFGAAL